MDSNAIVISLTAIIVLGTLAQWIGRITPIPSILLLILVGFVVGPFLGLIRSYEIFGSLLLPIVSLSVAIILFEGGLSLNFKKVKDLGKTILSLVFVGGAVSIALTFFFLYSVLDFSFAFALLESIIIVITGPTVIIPMINQLNIKEPVRSILRWEGLVIDPIGATFAVLVMDAFILQSQIHAVESIALGVILTFMTGFILGLCAAKLVLILLRKFLISDDIHNPMVLAILLMTFTLSNLIQADSGLVSVTVMGGVLANQKKTGVAHIAEFKENLRVILIAFLFITLSGAIDLPAILENLDESMYLLIFLIFVARPVSVVIATLFSNLSWKEVIFLSTVAPRGIIAASVSSLFGLQMARAGYSDGMILAPVTFTVIAGSVIFYGLVSPFIARKLGLAGIPDQGVLIVGANLFARKLGKALADQGFKVQLIDTDYWKVSESKQYTETPVYHGSFLTFEKENPEGMEGIGHLLAITESDGVNSLAVNHFSSDLNQANLYQLPPSTEKIPEHLIARPLFGEKYNFKVLYHYIKEGGIVKTTAITQSFTFENWRESYGDNAIPLFFIRRNGGLVPVTVKYTTPPTGLTKVIFLQKNSDGSAIKKP